MFLFLFSFFVVVHVAAVASCVEAERRARLESFFGATSSHRRLPNAVLLQTRHRRDHSCDDVPPKIDSMPELQIMHD